MKITNTSARLYYIAGQKLAPGQTAEIDDSWQDNASVKSSIAKGELKVAEKSEEVTAEKVAKAKDEEAADTNADKTKKDK